ncbi:phage tail tape measure protein [Georgenia sp. MJ170]|uniref:phage tail tape measure protein n=1 Tax=Georgenia sunbinii TaxID=3117728 RepID=UPI002F26D2BB
MTEATLARAYIQLIPTTKGAQEQITKELLPEADAAADKVGESSGKKFGASLAKGAAVGAAAVVGVGTALFKVGESVDSMSDTIAVSTGASGAALKSLEDDAKAIAASVPATFDDVGGSVAAFNTFVGASGDVLQDLSTHTLEASRLLGEDGVANSEAFGRAMQQWQIPAEDGAGTMDVLFRATQDYGVGLDGLIGHLSNYGPVLANVGFTMEESAVLFGQLEAGGINIGRVMPALNKSFRDWAAEGKDVQAELGGIVDQIANAEDGTEALAIATDVFGAQGASRMTAAIRSGTLELGDLATALGDTDGAIAASAEETDSFAEKWDLFRNNVLLKVEPVATRVFDAISDGMGWIVDVGIPAAEGLAAAIGDGWKGGLEDAEGPLEVVGGLARELFTFIEDTAIPAVKDLVDWMGENKDLLITVASALGGAAAAYGVYRAVVITTTAAKNAAAAAQRALNLVMRANPIGLIITAIGLLVGALIALYNNNETVREVIDRVWSAIKTGIGAVADWFTDTVWPALKTAMEAIGDAMSWVWENVIGPVWDGMSAGIDAVRNYLVDTVFPALSSAVEWIGDTFARIAGAIGEAWDGIRQAAAVPVNFVIDTVYNKGIRRVWNTIADKLGLSFTLPEVATVSWGSSTPAAAIAPGAGRLQHTALADGGMMPGYTPGRDVHTFVSPTGGVLELSGGEPVLRPEAGRVLGEGWVHGINAAARTGGTAGVSSFLGAGRQAFSEGGFWDKVGAGWSRTWRGAWGAVEHVGGVIKDVVVNTAQFIADPIEGVMNLVGGPVESLLGELGGNGWVEMLSELPRTIVSGLADKARDLVSGLFSSGDGPAFQAGGPVGAIPGARPHVNAAAWNIANAVGGVRMMQTINQSMAGGHPEGRAVDFHDAIGKLNQVASYSAANAAALGVDYIAWQGQLFRQGRGWFPQTRGYGNDPFHRTHVHVEWPHSGAGVFDEGGWIPPGLSVIENKTGKWEALANVTDAIEGGGGGGERRWVAEVHHYDGATSDDLAEDLLFAMRRADKGGKYATEEVLV